MQTFYELNHLWERRTAARGSFSHVQAEYYRQWREPDGSIPWVIHRIDRADPRAMRDFYEICPRTGAVLRAL